MPSTFTWLRYSERDRRRALAVVDLFKDPGTVDELGLGSIRDSFSALLFPGTSTVQTRACFLVAGGPGDPARPGGEECGGDRSEDPWGGSLPPVLPVKKHDTASCKET